MVQQFEFSKMKIKFVFVVLFILTANISVNCERYKNIGDCNYINDGTMGNVETGHFTFICVPSVRLNLLTKLIDTLVCKNGEYFAVFWIGYVNFENCEFAQIPSNLFEVYPNIHTFNVSFVGLKSLEAETFHEATELKALNVSHNEIIEIPPFIFLRTNELIDIDLSYNLLEQISIGMFSNLTNLKELNLSHNKLKILDMDILPSQLINLKLLSFSSNQLTELEFSKILLMQNLKINGMDSNHFNCSFLINFLEIIKPKNLVTAPNISSCYSWFRTAESSGTTTTKDTYDDITTTTELTTTGSIERNQQNGNETVLRPVNNSSAFKVFNDGLVTHLPAIIWINTIGLIVIIIILFWIVFRLRYTKQDLSAKV